MNSSHALNDDDEATSDSDADHHMADLPDGHGGGDDAFVASDSDNSAMRTSLRMEGNGDDEDGPDHNYNSYNLNDQNARNNHDVDNDNDDEDGDEVLRPPQNRNTQEFHVRTDYHPTRQYVLTNTGNYFHLSCTNPVERLLAASTGNSPHHADETWVVEIPRERNGDLKVRGKIQLGGAVLGLHFSSDGKFLLIAVRKYADSQPQNQEDPDIPADIEQDVELHLYCTKTFQLMRVLRGCVGYTGSICPFLILGEISPDNRFVACGSEDGKVRIWQAEYGKQLAELVSHTNVVNYVSWHPSGRYLISCSDDWTMKLWACPTEV